MADSSPLVAVIVESRATNLAGVLLILVTNPNF